MSDKGIDMCKFLSGEGIGAMRQELLMLYQSIQNTPALTIDLPADSGSGCITRIDANSFSLSSWNMKFN